MPAVGVMVREAADHILSERAQPSGPSLGGDLRPANLAQAYGIQQAVSRERGAIGGWRICHPVSETKCACAPLPIATIRPTPARIVVDGEPEVRLEPQLCFRIGRNLPDYDAPYTRAQVLAAIESCHPGVAVLNPRGAGASAQDPLAAIAESCGYRALVYGRALPEWPTIGVDCARISVMQGGQLVFSEPAAGMTDAAELLQWLANHGARWGEGLAVRQWVAIGLAAGEMRVATDNPVRVVLGSLGSVDLRFA